MVNVDNIRGILSPSKTIFISFSVLIIMIFKPTNIQKALLPFTEKYFVDGLFQVQGLARKNIVVLTIDDGLSSRSIELLELLDKFDAKATFFIHKNDTEKIDNYQEVISTMLAKGHEIGNHTIQDIPSRSLSAPEFNQQFREADLFLRNLGIKPRFFRAAGGLYDRTKMMPLLTELNYYPQFIMASFLPWDTHFPFPNIYATQLIDSIFSGAIVVFHDGEQKGSDRLERTFISLTKFLAGMKEKNYHILTLSEALAIAK